jgi:hypothetical protein
MSYARVDDAANHILQHGRGAELDKIDLKNAYHIIPVPPWIFVGGDDLC